MAFNDLPAELQSIIQQGFLERTFRSPLIAKLGFRAIADSEPFPNAIGETLTKTRTGLLPPVTTPMAPAQLTDIQNGLVPQNFSTEQYTLSIAQYAAPMMLNVVTSGVAIGSVYLQNAGKLGEQAMRSIDTIARNALYDRYMGGNTRVAATLGAPATTVTVDDIRGFVEVLTAGGTVVPVSTGNGLLVIVGSGTYTLTGAVADAIAPAGLPGALSLMTFSGTGTNTSTTPGGYSGTLTFSTNVSVANGTAGNAVLSAVAPLVLRPFKTSAMRGTTAAIDATELNDGRLTMDLVLRAKAAMSSNAVPGRTATGNFVMYADPTALTGLYADSAFQNFFQGREQSPEYRRGLVADLLGVEIVETNQAVQQTLSGRVIHRSIICGQGALVEGEYTGNRYAELAAASGSGGGLITMVDGIAHITRPPLDALQQVVTQSWAYIGGFVAPTDSRTDPTTIPTASNAAHKRAVMLETL